MRISGIMSICAIVAVWVLTGIGCVCISGKPGGVTLVQDGRPVCTIVLAQEPTRAAALAAVELQEHIRKITGAQVSIITDDSPAAGIRILIGESAATRKLGLRSADFKPQEYLIRAYANELVLMGRDKPDPLLTDNTVTVSGKPEWVEGKFGKALSFDGAKNALAVNDSGFADDAGTLEAWVRFGTAANDAGTILRLDGDSPWTYHIVQRQGSSIQYVVYDGNDGKKGTSVTSVALAEGWHHVLATHDAKAAKIELFIDGRSQGTAKYVQTTCRNRTLCIGGMLPDANGKVGNPFAGLIDEVRVSTAISAPVSDWAITPCVADDNTVTLLRFDTGDGTPKRDKLACNKTLIQQVLQEPPLPNFYDDQATCYAVYDFLERFCDVRWYNSTDSGTICPQTKTLTVNVRTVRRTPVFAMRTGAGFDSGSNLFPVGLLWWEGDGPAEAVNAYEAAAFSVMHKRFPNAGSYGNAKCRAIQVYLHRMRLGGERNLCNHSFYSYYDRFWRDGEKKSPLFEKKRPDYFAKGYEGAGEPPQLCYTSRSLIEQVAKDARDYYDGKKTGAQLGIVWNPQLPNLFPVEPMDNNQFCKCPECQKWLNAREEESVFFSNGRDSDYFFNFVNEVARELRKTHPDKGIICLAYMTHAAPPEHVKLDPGVAVQYCFACNRLPYDRQSYEHELKLLEAWGKETKTRPVYLWLYYTFPREVAVGGKFSCFPGFFAHAVGEQFKLFHKYGYRGIFHCGYGQEVESYLTFKLMDDPTLDVDQILDEYFQRLYGAAAAPMKQIYLDIENIYCDPKNYPPEIATGKLEGHHHQTAEIAWVWLGNKERMNRMASLMDQAKAAATTDLEKKRVDLFEKGIWSYMVAGRRKDLETLKTTSIGAPPQLRVFQLSQPANGKLAKVDWTEATTLTRWRLPLLVVGPRRTICARAAHDGKCLYLQLRETGLADTLVSCEDIVSGDYVRITMGAQRQGAYREVRVNPAGKHLERESQGGGAPASWTGATVEVSTEQDGGEWIVRLAIPLEQTIPGGAKPGQTIFVNLAQRCSGDDVMMSPSISTNDEFSRMVELHLDTAEESLPGEVLSPEQAEKTAQEGLVGWWRADGRGKQVKDCSANKNHGTLVGPIQRVAGLREQALQFTRALQYVDLGAPPAFDLNGPLTLESWVRVEDPKGYVGGYPAIFGKGYDKGSYSLHIRGLGTQGSGTLWFELDGADGQRTAYNPAGVVVTENEWSHVVATYDTTTMRIYINGRQVGNGLQKKVEIAKCAEPLRIGWLPGCSQFTGSIEDVRLYNRALSPGEVFAHFKAGWAGKKR